MNNKIVSLTEFTTLQKETLTNKKIVFTNGCFDILHPGHTDYLSKAKQFGDVLVLGLNSDTSIQRLKGSDRPIQNLKARALVLSALASVDYIISFDDDTPIHLIETIKPNVLVKGGDYTEDKIVGATAVKASGGSVAIVPFLTGYSTSNIIDKIKG